MAKRVREFDLDAPTLTKNRRSEFRYQTRSLSNLYEKCIAGKVVLDKAWKVLVEVVPLITFATRRNLLGVLVVQIEHDPASFFDIGDDRARSECALQWLLEGATKLANDLDVSKEPFVCAADRVRALSFDNISVWIKPCVSPSGNMKADIVVNHRMRDAIVLGRILDSDNSVISEHVLASERPDEFVFASMIGSLSWIDDQTVELRSKDRRTVWQFGKSG